MVRLLQVVQVGENLRLHLQERVVFHTGGHHMFRICLPMLALLRATTGEEGLALGREVRVSQMRFSV